MLIKQYNKCKRDFKDKQQLVFIIIKQIYQMQKRFQNRRQTPKQQQNQGQAQDNFSQLQASFLKSQAYSNQFAHQSLQKKQQRLEIKNNQSNQYFLGAYDKVKISLRMLQQVQILLYLSNKQCQFYLLLQLNQQMITLVGSQWRVAFHNKLLALQTKQTNQQEDQYIKQFIQYIAMQRENVNSINSKFTLELRKLLVEPIIEFVDLIQTQNEEIQFDVNLMGKYNNYITVKKIERFVRTFILEHELNIIDQFDFQGHEKRRVQSLKQQVQFILRLRFNYPFSATYPHEKIKSKSPFDVAHTHFREIRNEFAALQQDFHPKWKSQELQLRRKINLGTYSEAKLGEFQRMSHQRKNARQQQLTQIAQHHIKNTRAQKNLLQNSQNNQQISLHLYYSPPQLLEDLKTKRLNLKQFIVKFSGPKTRVSLAKFISQAQSIQKIEMMEHGHEFDWQIQQRVMLNNKNDGKLKHISYLNTTTAKNHTNRWFNFNLPQNLWKLCSKERFQQIFIRYINSNKHILFLQVPKHFSKILKFFAEQKVQARKRITLVLGNPYQLQQFDPDQLKRFSTNAKDIEDLSIDNVCFPVEKLKTVLKEYKPSLNAFRISNCQNLQEYQFLSQFGNSLKELRMQGNGQLPESKIPKLCQDLSRLQGLEYFSIQSLTNANISFNQTFLKRLKVFEVKNQKKFKGQHLNQLLLVQSINFSGCDDITSLANLYMLAELKSINLSFMEYFNQHFNLIEDFLTNTAAQNIEELAILGYEDRIFKYDAFSKIKNVKSLAIDSLGQNVNLKAFLTYFASLEKLTVSCYYDKIQQQLNRFYKQVEANPLIYQKQLQNRKIQLYRR